MDEHLDKDTLRRIRILLSLQRALVGSITPDIRAVSVSWDAHCIDIYFIYNGKIKEDDQEDFECVASEVLSSFPDDDVRTHHIRCDLPQKVPELGNTLVFYRKETL